MLALVPGTGMKVLMLTVRLYVLIQALGGGIYRQVRLVKLNPTHIVTQGVFVDPMSSGKTANASLEFETHGAQAATASATFDLFTHEGQHLGSVESSTGTAQPGTTTTLKATLQLSSVKLWDIKAPQTYLVVATLKNNGAAVDQVNRTVGFRTTTWSGSTGFSLNGKNFEMRGFSHHNSLAGIGVAVPDRLQLFKVSLS